MKSIPEGWVRVSAYDERDDKGGGGPTGDYARILHCIKRENSPIRWYRDGRYLVACKEDIDEFLRGPEQHEKQQSGAADSTSIDKRHAESVCQSLVSIDTTLDEIYRVLERMATAVESIATQPKTAQHEAVATVGSNGFHN